MTSFLSIARHACTVTLASCILLGSYGSQAAERVILGVDWASAQRVQASDSARHPDELEKFRSVVPSSKLLEAELPVLAIAGEAVRASPRFESQGTAYAALYTLRGAKLTVMGSIGAISSETLVTEVTEPLKFDFVSTEDGADLSFIRFNASYTIRLTCDELSDERCESPDYLTTIANSLIVVGGAPK